MLHRLKASAETVHVGFYDARLEPVLKVASGDSVDLDTLSGKGGMLSQREEERMYDEMPALRAVEAQKDKGPGLHQLTGPIALRGAEPGDTLAVTIEKISPSTSFGFNLIIPGAGTIPEDYPYVRVRAIPYDKARKNAVFSPRIRIPLSPFFGHHGVAPPALRGRVSSSIPGVHGGNIDNKELVAGSTIYLPVHVPGANYSVGDGHAVQGDGEVDVTALEAGMRATLRFELKKGMKLTWPTAETATHFMCMAFHEDLDEAAKIALRGMIGYLEAAKGLDRDDAYMLCSLAVDIRVSQLVNGLKGIHAMLPKAIFSAKV